MFCSGWCFRLITRAEILYIKTPWKDNSKPFVEKKGKHLTMFWFPTSYLGSSAVPSSKFTVWEKDEYIPKFPSISMHVVSRVSKLHVADFQRHFNPPPQCGGTEHDIQEHFVFQKCHLKMNSLGKWFWLIEILRFFFFQSVLCVSLSSTIVGIYIFVVVVCDGFFPPLFCNWENVCHLWKLTLVVDLHVAK